MLPTKVSELALTLQKGNKKKETEVGSRKKINEIDSSK